MKTIAMMVLTTTLIAPSAIAQLRPSDGGTWYYEIGGADPYMFGYTNRTRVTLGLGANWSVGNACSFDPKATITDTFANAEYSLNAFIDDVAGNAASLAAGWGISKLQEMNPGLYDLITKGLADARNSYNLSVKNCQEIVSDNQSGRNPVDGWIKVSKADSWKEKTSSGGNAVEADREISENPGEEGVTWVGGRKAGGIGQPPIQTIGDSVFAGYNHLTNNGQSSGDSGNDDESNDGIGNDYPADQRVTRIWSTPENASEWVTSVVGEEEVRVCNNCEKLKTRVGQGLRLQVQSEKTEVDEELAPLLQTHDSPTTAELDAISVPGMGLMITEPVILALREETGPERALLANRLSAEVALARTMEKALVALDLLKAGRQEANIAANAEAKAAIDNSIARLQDEIDGILYERDVRQRVLADTARLLSERHSARSTSPTSGSMGPSSPLPSIKDGGIPLTD